ncbi:MAG TPA: hypothetical protein VGC99_25440 [Candidatus Tectomicrobia bacterium]
MSPPSTSGPAEGTPVSAAASGPVTAALVRRRAGVPPLAAGLPGIYLSWGLGAPKPLPGRCAPALRVRWGALLALQPPTPRGLRWLWAARAGGVASPSGGWDTSIPHPRAWRPASPRRPLGLQGCPWQALRLGARHAAVHRHDRGAFLPQLLAEIYP